MYYKHSGRFSLGGLVIAGFVGCVAAVILAYAYGRGIIYIPEVKLAAFAAIAFGCLVGVATGYGLVWGKIRNDRVGSLFSAGVSALALYLSWTVWVASTLESQHVQNLSWIALAERPGALWNVVCMINQYGTWGMSSGSTTTGWALWIIWFLEAVCVIGGGAFVGLAVLRAHVFCESCGNWCKRGAKLMLAPPSPDVAQLKLQLEANDLHSLESLGPGTKGTDHLDVALDSCPQCRQFHTMTVVHTMIQRSKAGKPTVTNHTIVKHLLIGPGHAEILRQLSEKVSPAAKIAPSKVNMAAAGKK